jgi:hypothetical protein
MIDTSEYGYGASFVDWTKPKLSATEINKLKQKMTKEEREMYEEFSENNDFATATNNIYKINASTSLLKEKDIANMFKGDLVVIRNTIYARHGYAFKSKPLRAFFEKQDWYVPIKTDIKNELTEIEKQNIALLLMYEKNAKEYFDNFGRG